MGRSLPGDSPPLFRAVRHHLILVIVTLLAALGCAGLYYLAVHEESYTAQATVLLNPVPGNPLSPETAATSGTQLTMAMETEAGIVATPPVAQLVADETGEVLPGPTDTLSAAVPSGTQMVQITYTNSSPGKAQQAAQAYAEAFLEFRGDNAEETQSTKLDALQQQLDHWQQRLEEATQATRNGDGLASEQVQIASARVAELNASIGEVEVISTNPGSVTSPAIPPTSADGLPTAVVLGAVGIGGLLIGAVLALFAEWRRDLVRDDEETEIAGLPVFATLPADTPDGVVVSGSGNDLAHEAYRRLRAGIVANCAAPHAVAVSAVGVGRDASVVASNLALAIRQAGFSAILISANPDGDGVAGVLDVPDGPGLAEVISDGSSIPTSIVEVDGIAVLRAGDVARSRELLAGPDLQVVVDVLKESYDYVIVNAASTGTADGDAAVSVANSVLLAVISSQTTHNQVAAALDRFSRLDIHPVGLVNTPSATTGEPRQVRGPVDDATRTPARGRQQPENTTATALHGTAHSSTASR